MNRKELEQKVIDIDTQNKKHTEAEIEALLKEIKSTSTEDLEYYLKEYQAYLDFIAAVEELKLKS